MSSSPSPPSGSGNAPSNDPNPPTVAPFSPASNRNHLRSTILVHQKSPLLVATPPQITRALAYSYPFLLPLNKLVGLLSWTTDDPWESFLLVAAFWFVILYGDVVVRWAGPIVLVVGLILGMYSRRYSLLSSSGVTGEKVHKRNDSDPHTSHHKSLDEIVDALKLFTTRCNILLDPFLNLTDFLSTQRTATSATTRPALTTLFIRILLVSPVWYILTLPPFYIITTRRVVITFGTLALSWHSRPARVSRTIIWRSRSVRRVCTILTGLDFGEPTPRTSQPVNADGTRPPLPPRKTPSQIALSLAQKNRRPSSPGIRFTFTIFENQRRWLAIGWTHSMLAYERASWTDEHLNASSPPSKFTLPEVEGGLAHWRWVDGSQWRVDSAADAKSTSSSDSGWWYYDNKWRDGRRTDGWGRYTRRRKWFRDAELIERPLAEATAEAGKVSASTASSTTLLPTSSSMTLGKSMSSSTGSASRSATPRPTHKRASSSLSVAKSTNGTASSTTTTATLGGSTLNQDDNHTHTNASETHSEPSSPSASTTAFGTDNDDGTSSKSRKRKSWFRRGSVGTARSVATVDTAATGETSGSRGSRDEEEDVHSPFQEREERNWGLADEYRMGFG